MFIKEELKRLVPRSKRGMITESLVEALNKMQYDPMFFEAFKENFLLYKSAMISGRNSVNEYVNAVKFVTYKLLEYTDYEAYIATFPERHRKAIETYGEEKGMHYLDRYAGAFKKSKMVTQIMEQTIIPSWVVNAPLYQKAINELARLMYNARSDTAKVNAAIALLQHTKPPEVQKIQLDLGVQTNDSIDELKETIAELSKTQLQLMKMGNKSLKDVAESNIITLKEEDYCCEDEDYNDDEE